MNFKSIRKETGLVIIHNHNPLHCRPNSYRCSCLNNSAVYNDKIYCNTLAGRLEAIVPYSASLIYITCECTNGAILSYNGVIHTIGGMNNSSTSTKHFRYDESTNAFVIESTLPTAFSKSPATVHANKIHIFPNDGNHYAWDGNSWTQVSTPPYSACGAVSCNNYIYIYTENGLYKYDNNSWILIAPPVTLTYYDSSAFSVSKFYQYNSMVAFNNKIYIMDYYKYHVWDGNAWSEYVFPYLFGSFIVYQNDLYVCGEIDLLYKLPISS